MKKYFQIARNTIALNFTYRLNFILWRVRIIISFLMSFYLWKAVFASTDFVLGYNEEKLLTYILMVNLLSGIVMSTQTYRVADEINTGKLNSSLITPIDYLKFNIARDLGDKLVSIVFTSVEIIFLIILFKPPIFFQSDFFSILGFFFATAFAVMLFFEVNLLLSFIGFWSNETWAPRFIFTILVIFLAGTYFPLDILPEPIYQTLKILPFPYMIFFPIKIYLGGIPIFGLLPGFLLMIAWIIGLWFLLHYVWFKGLRIYTAHGS